MRTFRLTCLLVALISASLYSRAQKTLPSSYLAAEKYYNSPNATALTDSLALLNFARTISLLTGTGNFKRELADSYLKSGILHMSAGKSEQALTDFRNATLFIADAELSDSLLFQPEIYVGSVHYALNNLDSAIYYFKKAELITGKYPRISESERLFNKFGALYYETGDYNKSISYFKKALSLTQEKRPVNVFFVVNYKNNIATALMKLGRYDEALGMFEDLLKYPHPADELYYNIGSVYYESGNFQQALMNLRRVNNMYFEKYSSLAKIFFSLHQYDSAKYYLSQAIPMTANIIPSKLSLGIIQKYTGDLLVAEKKPQEALRHYQSAIHFLDPVFSDTSITANPTHFSGLQNFKFLFETLIAKANTLRDISAQNKKFLEAALSSYTSALVLVSYIEKTYFSDNARLFLKNSSNAATAAAVDVAIELFNDTKNKQFVSQAFGLIENNKATVLQAGLRSAELSDIPGLSPELVQQERKYKLMLAKLNILASAGHTDAALEKNIHDLEMALLAVQDKMDENPAYHRLKFAETAINADSLRSGLKNDEAILSYYYTGNRLFCFYLLKDELGFTAVSKKANLFTTIGSLRSELEDPSAVSNSSLRKKGIELFADLVEPVYKKIRDKNRLIIIPYNEISYVPFEMMELKDGSLMLQNYAISYNYSANFLSHKRTENKTPYTVLAMAPFATKNSDLLLPALPASADEISGLQGKIFIGEKATKKQFEEESAAFPVIHLATHAIANDTNQLGSYIEFFGLKNSPDSQHRLYEKEIYALDLKAVSLVILSACETGNGLMINGEGVISLSRSFSYAGCKTVITSLWKADEISTSFIAKRLHEYMKKGMAVDMALQKTKIDYIKSDEFSPRYKNPAFWAHLIVMGDFSPIVETSHRHWLIVFCCITLIALVLILMIKKRNGHRNMPVS